MFVESQAVQSEIHFHHAWVVWFGFAFGAFVHWLLSLWKISKDHKTDIKDTLLSVWVPLVWRVTVGAVLFSIIWMHPDLLALIPKLLGHPLSQDEMSVVTLPMNNAIAIVWGLFIDSVLAYVPYLKSQAPINGN